MSSEETELPAPTGPRAAFGVIRQRNFGPYFVGNAFSASGTWFQNLAASLLLFRLTGSAFLLGVLNFAIFIPVLVLAPWAGSAADRFDRRRLLLVTQSCAVVLSATLGVLALTDHAGAVTVIVFALLLGVVSAFSAPAQQAMVSSLVSRRDLGSAIALNSMTFNIARASGPALAAAAIAAFGIPWAFLINAGVVPRLHRRAPVRPPAAAAPGGADAAPREPRPAAPAAAPRVAAPRRRRRSASRPTP